ncbi:class I SAM-dependent methyltransferase [bacterium]|nr:class I SAM-dependent methyltransferase [bacterium]
MCSKDIENVRHFWEENPLFQGEGKNEIGSKEWFIEWEDVYINDCYAGHEPESIYTKGLQKESKILDVGCGPGFWVRYFLKKGFVNVSACDLTSKAVELTLKSLELFNITCKPNIKVGNAEQLSYPDESFDHINCQGVIHYVPDTKKAIVEFHRVLKPHGTACFSVYHKFFLLRHPFLLKIILLILRRIINLRGRGRETMLNTVEPDEIVRRYDGENNPIGQSFTIKEMKTMVDGLFEITEIQHFYFPARAFPFKIPKIVHRWLHKHYGLLIVIHANKC